jgi:prefoldin subunit 5
MVRKFQEEKEKQHTADENRISELVNQIDSLHQFQAEHLTAHSETVDALKYELEQTKQKLSSLIRRGPEPLR